MPKNMSRGNTGKNNAAKPSPTERVGKMKARRKNRQEMPRSGSGNVSPGVGGQGPTWSPL